MPRLHMERTAGLEGGRGVDNVGTGDYTAIGKQIHEQLRV